MREYNDLKQAMKYAGTGLTLVMAIAASGCAHQQAEPELAPAAPATPLPERAAPVVRENTVSSQLRADAPLRYVVKKGDTLWDIARQHQVTVSALLAANRLNRRAAIHPGDKLRITVRKSN